MGPVIPLNFFMTRLLFMDQAKVDSLKAKNVKNEVEIVVDNPKIIPEDYAKSLPPVPFPPAAPESPKSVEGWKGVKVGGWLCMGKAPVPPDLDDSAKSNHTAEESAQVPELSKLSLDDNDDTEMTEESTIAAADTTVATSAAAPAAPVETRKQLFPQNSKRNLRQPSGGSKRSLGKKGPSLKGIARPTLKKKNSSKSKQIADSSSPSNSGAEDN